MLPGNYKALCPIVSKKENSSIYDFYKVLVLETHGNIGCSPYKVIYDSM